MRVHPIGALHGHHGVTPRERRRRPTVRDAGNPLTSLPMRAVQSSIDIIGVGETNMKANRSFSRFMLLHDVHIFNGGLG